MGFEKRAFFFRKIFLNVIVEDQVNRNEIIFREGRKEDSKRIAELDNMAADGALDFLFQGLIPGMTPVQIVAQGLENDHYPHSFRSTIVAEHNHQIVGMSLSFPSKYHAITEELRNFFPADRLEHFKDFSSSRVEGSYFLDALCVQQNYRKMGIGRELINRTVEKAKKEKFTALSLIVFADNEKAVRLYKKYGFEIAKHIDLKPMRCCLMKAAAC